MKSSHLLFKQVFAGIFLFIFPVLLNAGNINLNSSGTSVSISENSYQKLAFNCSISDISTQDVSTPEGNFTSLSIAGFGQRNIPGEPALPVYRKLIEVPLEATFTINIIRQHFVDIDLSAAGSKMPVFPAQPPLSKSDDPSKVKFMYDRKLYEMNDFLADELTRVTSLGIMRSLNLARIDISPVQYNPVTNTLRVFDVLEVEVVFNNANIGETILLKQSKASPYFGGMYTMVSNYKPLDPTDELVGATPVTYVIISDPMFQTILQPFVEWKKKKGFRVIEGYTSNPLVGTTTTSIKSYLQGLYTTPAAGYSAPSFVLIVGDVAQVPAWAGSAGSHVTDLRYCEYTGDNFPEVYYGRFSATSVAELQPQIDKTLEYEQYTMPDPSFLNEAVMAAGADASYQTHSNGQIYYGTENYFNAAHNINSHTYLQPEPSGGNYATNIHTNVSNGVAYANYTAHCSESGWADPSFLISDITALSNAHKYCLMVGNCCMSTRFDVNCFAEQMLRAANKGAVGYIGASNYSYWDEDYYWGCGFKSIVLHPSYDAAHLGAYDGTFHDHGEATSDWFVTQGQMVVCGDYAVEESASSRKTYYWEIYHLMGDPSLMIYYSVPSALTATYENTLMIGMTSLAVTTEPNAYIALTSNGTLLDAKLANVSGAATLNFSALNTVGNLNIVITKQNKQPLIGTIGVIPASGPYVVYNSHTLTDPAPNGNNNGLMDFGETDQLSVALKNVGVAVASNVITTLSTTDSYITVTDNTENFGNINPNEIVSHDNAFTLNVSNTIPDQHVVPFTVSSTNGSNTWNSSFNITANAPVLSVGTMTILDNGAGCNNNGILDPGETADLLIQSSNTGHCAISGASGTLAIVGGSSPYLTLNSTTATLGTIAAGGSVNATFNVTANASTPIGTPVDLQYNLTAGSFNASATKQVVIGLIPTYVMSTTSVTGCVGNFYDPGGASASYSNSQDYTMTFYPGSAGSTLRFIFNSFTLESNTSCGYDYLSIYDGTSASATLIGKYCGTTSPGTVLATNAAGALTFVFHSDVSEVFAGWDASFSCISGVIINPATFTATSVSTSQIDLNWTKNPSGHNVMIASSASPTFGTPVNGTSYSPGSSLTGGGTIIYSGNGTSFSHTSLNSNSTYYYKAFSYDGSNSYSTGLAANAATMCGISVLPVSESFSASAMPNCWSVQNIGTGITNKWTVSNTASAGGAAYEMKSTYQSINPGITRLVTPPINTIGMTQLDLGFKHMLDDYGAGATLHIQSSTDGTNWTNEAWSLATASNAIVGPATVATTVTHNLNSPNTFIAFEIDGNLYQYDYWYIDNITVTGNVKTLTVNILLEGLYQAGGTMRKAQNATGDQFTGTTADQVTIELHNAGAYGTIEYTASNVNLSTSGNAIITIPAALNSSYYITVKHRNGIAATSANPVSFEPTAVTYSFSSRSQAYAGNLGLMPDGYTVMYSGDVNQDGVIDSEDLIPVDNLIVTSGTGYLPSDANGDGMINSNDITIINRNAENFVSVVNP